MATARKIMDNDDAGSLPVLLVEATLGQQRGPRTLVSESETVHPEVKWQPENRHFHDKMWGILFLVAWAAFFGLGMVLVKNANPRYEWISSGLMNTSSTNTEPGMIPVRVVSSHFRDDVATCCAKKGENNLTGYYDLCSELTADSVIHRRLSKFIRRLPDDFEVDGFNDDDFLSNATTSKLEQGDGVFDAFLAAPEIIITMVLLSMALSVFWMVLLRFFASPIIFGTEILKVVFLLSVTVKGWREDAFGVAVVAFVCAVTVVAWDIYTWKQLIFAGKVLSYTVTALKANAAMFYGLIPFVVLYAGNGAIFVWFFARSFEVVEVESNIVCRYLTSGDKFCEMTCDFAYPSYATPLVVYLGFSYLWSILLFHTMRLSIIATVVGSWHFHSGVDREPGVLRALINTCTTSIGTLSVASLVSTIAERLNRMLLSKSLVTQCWNPIFWVIMPVYLVCGSCIKMVILMLTKFSVILHVFNGKPWIVSARKAFKILKRHFKGGFVTEYASTSVLSLGAYVFSMAIYSVAWFWLDKEFETNTFIGVNENTMTSVGWMFFALFNIWYPVLGLYLIILANSWLLKSNWWSNQGWVIPLAATFIACLAMMFFTYLSGIFLDTVDVLFLCFAIDRDNNVDMSNDEFAKLVFEGVPTLLVGPDLDGVANSKDEEAAPAPNVAATE
jgi:Plasma-membrane choline transporter